jgi:transposase
LGIRQENFAHRKRTGQKERPAQLRHGPVCRIACDLRKLLFDWLCQQSDLTEVELRDRLQTAGVIVCKSRVGQVLGEMGLRRKKKRSTPRSATAKPTAHGGKRSSPPSPRSYRKS